MAQTLTDFFSEYFTAEVVVFLISMLPILELRGGMIAASLLDIPWAKAVVICVAGNLLPIPFILLLIKQIFALLKKLGPMRKLVEYFERKAQRGGVKLIEKYPRKMQLALLLFVGIPLPGTGAWTGSLIASFLDMPVRKSLPMILLGVLMAMGIMSVLAYLLPSFLGLKI